MKCILISAVLIGLISMSSSQSPQQVARLLELNSMFNLMHRNYENQINRSWMLQKRNLDIYNAQFLSRYGFVVQQVKDREIQVLEAIDARAQEIGNPNAECLEVIRYALNNSIEYAGLNFKATNNETIYYFNRASANFFYPLVETLQYQSNTLQWEVINALGRNNPVTEITQLIETLEEDYYLTVMLYEIAIENLANEQRLYTREMNQVKVNIFPIYNSVLAYYMFTTNTLLGMLPGCNE